MKILSLLVAVLTVSLTLVAGDAEAARRLGGGGSSGMQRQMAPQHTPSATPGAARATPPTAAPQAQPKRSWMGPLAGLAAGLGLAALASHFGFGEELASMMMIGLLIMVVMMVVGMIMRRRAAPPEPAMAGSGLGGGMPYSASGAEQATQSAYPSYGSSAPVIGGGLSQAGGTASAFHTPAPIPADFDVAGFVSNAKVQFVRLQAANDARDLDYLRDFTTPQMYAELKLAIDERGNAPQHTEVVSIDAEVLEVVEESTRYIVSARFFGSLREERHGPTEAVDEMWHLVKARDGSSGWLLAGIQQRQ